MLTLILLWFIGQALKMGTAYWVIWWAAIALNAGQLIHAIYKAGQKSGDL